MRQEVSYLFTSGFHTPWTWTPKQ